MPDVYVIYIYTIYRMVYICTYIYLYIYIYIIYILYIYRIVYGTGTVPIKKGIERKICIYTYIYV